MIQPRFRYLHKRTVSLFFFLTVLSFVRTFPGDIETGRWGERDVKHRSARIPHLRN